MRARMDGFSLRINRPSDGQPPRSVQFAFEDPELQRVGQSVLWVEDEEPLDMLERLFEALKDTGRSPGDKALSQSDLIADSAREIRDIIDLHDGLDPAKQVGPVVELITKDWAITSDGLQALNSNIHLTRSDLFGDFDKAFNRIAPMLDGLDRESFLVIFRYAKVVQGALQKEEQEKQWEKLMRFSDMLGRAGF